MKLATALTDSGCILDPQVFRDLVKATFLEMHAALTDELLYCRPAEALVFCGEVRRRARSPELSDELVLRTLTNIRKHGDLPRLKHRTPKPGTRRTRVHARPGSKAGARDAGPKMAQAIQA